MTERPRISIVIPAYNEAESLPELHRELVATLESLGHAWEIVYVDDGSRDGSDDVIAPSFVGEYVHRNTPESTFYSMNATGHCPNLSAPEETVDAIKSWL